MLFRTINFICFVSVLHINDFFHQSAKIVKKPGTGISVCRFSLFLTAVYWPIVLALTSRFTQLKTELNLSLFPGQPWEAR